MKFLKTLVACFSVGYVVAAFLPLPLEAEDLPHPDTYAPSAFEFSKLKPFYDDPRPCMEDIKNFIPPELREKL